MVEPRIRHRVRAILFTAAGLFALVPLFYWHAQVPSREVRVVALDYPFDELVLTRGEEIAPLLPTAPGGWTRVTVDPALPTGVVLDEVSGIVSGRPTVVWPPTVYRIHASSPNGSGETKLTLSVRDNTPTNLSYGTNPAIYVRGVPIVPNFASTMGGEPTSYTVQPPLPAGLHLDPTSGAIYGVPETLALPATYVVTATSTGGEAHDSLTVSVVDVAPSRLSYESDRPTYSRGKPIVPNRPTSDGGVVTQFAIVPPLPEGLSIDPQTGVISGSPTQTSDWRKYTVTASNTGGETTAVIELAVADGIAPARVTTTSPTGLVYPKAPIVARKGEPFRPLVPRITGGKPTRFSVTPSLPPGLAIDGANGALVGTPTVPAVTTSHTVTAWNAAGDVRATIVLRVVDLPPVGLAYATRAATYAQGAPIAPNVPTAAGGTIETYRTNEVLPAGLLLDPRTGILRGTPTVAAPPRPFTVIGENSGGRTETTIVIGVEPPNRRPGAIAQRVAMPVDTPTVVRLRGMDPDEHRLTFRVVTPPLHGTLDGEPPVVTYRPRAGYRGADVFTFRAEDPYAASDPATVELQVGEGFEAARGPASGSRARP